MAVITWEALVASGPTWTDMGNNRLVFSGSTTNINTTVAALSFQDGTHLGSGTPGSDVCGASHPNNVKILTATTCSIAPAGSNPVAAGSTNISAITDNQCTFKVKFTDPTAYQLQNGKIYTYDSVTTTNPANGVDAAIWVTNNAANQPSNQWFVLNSYSTTGNSMSFSGGGANFATNNFGGDNTNKYLPLYPKSSANVLQEYYAAFSCSPESAGGKANYAIGAYLEYF